MARFLRKRRTTAPAITSHSADPRDDCRDATRHPQPESLSDGAHLPSVHTAPLAHSAAVLQPVTHLPELHRPGKHDVLPPSARATASSPSHSVSVAFVHTPLRHDAPVAHS